MMALGSHCDGVRERGPRVPKGMCQQGSSLNKGSYVQTELEKGSKTSKEAREGVGECSRHREACTRTQNLDEENHIQRVDTSSE